MSDILRDVYAGLPDGIPTPNTDAALRGAADLIRDRWMWLAGAHVDSGAYLKSIRSADTEHPFGDGGDDDTTGVHSDLPEAQYIEWGHAGFNLTQAIHKWKSGRNGPYVIVPFRHDKPPRAGEGRTPASAKRAMPSDIYASAKRLPLGGRLGTYGDRGKKYRDYNAMRDRYGNQPWIPGVAGYQWRSSPYDRMYRYDSTPSPRGGSHTKYMTFRTIKPGSEGWVIPPSPGFHFAEQALNDVLPEIQALLEEAAHRDMLGALEDALDWMR